MLSLFGSLNMAAQSLSVQQAATAVAGQNLANVNNPAYARQRLNIQTATPLPTPIGEEGTGVQAISITQIRDALLDTQIQSEGSVSGSLSSQQNALEDAQTYLNEQLGNTTAGGAASSPNGLASDLSNLFGAFQTLSTDAGNIADRQSLVQTAQQLTAQFNSVSAGLATVQSNLNSSITSDVAAGNQDLTDIASLNQQIIIAKASGGTANDLVDLREQKIEDLAGKVNLTATAQPDGSLDISIGGVTMVSGADTPDSLQAYDSGGGNMLVRAQAAGTTLALSGGSIEGSITARDGALASLQSSINTLASQLITQVNNVYSTGYDLYGHGGQDFFTGNDAASIGVNSLVVNDPSTFQAGAAGGNHDDNVIVLALAQLANQPVSGSQTFSQSYSQTVAALGSALASVNDQSTNSAAVTQMLNTQRASVSGVSTDEEMTNLVQFQKAYQASAEFITTINQMLETLVSMKTV